MFSFLVINNIPSASIFVKYLIFIGLDIIIPSMFKLFILSLKHLIYDPHGLKTKIYQTIDSIFKTKYAVYSSNVILENTEFLNLEHETWYNPWDKTKKNSSVLDIYADAKKECLEIFEATINYLEDKITLKEYQKVLQAKSYVTGLPYTNHYSNLKLSF